MARPVAKPVYSTDDDVSPADRRAESDPPAGAPADPAAPFAVQGTHPVRVLRTRKGRGGKTVCIISGIRSPRAGKEALLKHLKGKMGAGGVIRGDDLEIQGDQRDRIVELLVALGYQARAAGG